ncbi:hypothetical protein KJ781_00605 [Patescibacteria group bacterium]|nr:hypothetical protein [Patescibacteria group bacterium]MBU1448730.1 hypothetical protein [Patescibacteria group bacterium]MBU2613012.1 hypothetical protein [Patescibacteria group bacterium]
MKQTPSAPIAGLFQAVVLGLYVFGVVTLMNAIGSHDVPSNATLQGMTILLLFVLSATICASVMLGYPALLLRDGKIKQALTVIGWSIVWLAIIFAVTLTVALTS